MLIPLPREDKVSNVLKRLLIRQMDVSQASIKSDNYSEAMAFLSCLNDTPECSAKENEIVIVVCNMEYANKSLKWLSTYLQLHCETYSELEQYYENANEIFMEYSQADEQEDTKEITDIILNEIKTSLMRIKKMHKDAMILLSFINEGDEYIKELIS